MSSHGGRRQGAGRKLRGSLPMKKVAVTLPGDMVDDIRRVGNDNLSEGVRLMHSLFTEAGFNQLADEESAKIGPDISELRRLVWRTEALVTENLGQIDGDLQLKLVEQFRQMESVLDRMAAERIIEKAG